VGQDSTGVDIRDLKSCIEHREPVEYIADFLCRQQAEIRETTKRSSTLVCELAIHPRRKRVVEYSVGPQSPRSAQWRSLLCRVLEDVNTTRGLQNSPTIISAITAAIVARINAWKSHSRRVMSPGGFEDAVMWTKSLR
jgi:hypothetical protein